MPDNRYFYPGDLKGTISLSGEEMRHMIKAMRKRKGDQVEIVNGRGSLAKATIQKIDARATLLAVVEVFTAAPPAKKLILAQGLPRLPKLDLIIEKGTELGATAFWLFPAQNSEKKELSKNQKERLDHLAIAALKQCGRLYLPDILMRPPLASWEEIPSPAFYGEPEAPRLFPMDDALMFIGPEKGFTQKEKEFLKKREVEARSLHKNILRAETAALCALSLLSLNF